MKTNFIIFKGFPITRKSIKEAATRGVLQEKVFLEILQNSQENTCTRVSFFTKLQACNFIKKETLALVFSCEFSKISKSTFFHRTPLVASSGYVLWKSNFINPHLT